MVQFLRMETFIQMMRHHPRNLGFKFQLNRFSCLDTRRDYVSKKCIISYTNNQYLIFTGLFHRRAILKHIYKFQKKNQLKFIPISVKKLISNVLCPTGTHSRTKVWHMVSPYLDMWTQVQGNLVALAGEMSLCSGHSNTDSFLSI